MVVAQLRPFDLALNVRWKTAHIKSLLIKLCLLLGLKKHLNLAKRKVVVLNNPNAAEVLSAVQPGHWIVPWHQLLQGDMNHGEQLCTVQQLKALCD